MTKTALITGILGQDGAYLAKLLLEHGYRVIGGCRAGSHRNLSRLESLDISESIEYTPLDLLEPSNIWTCLRAFKPSVVYNLAALSFVGNSFAQPVLTTEVNALGVLRLLDAIHTINPETKFYQASTSEMFGQALQSPQDETTPFQPRSPYGYSKLMAHWATVNYREAHEMFCCSGILFNHESPLRGNSFVTQKIVQAVARVDQGQPSGLMLGNLDAQRDWGFAGDYVEAMYRMMQHPCADTYVIATGQQHSVREFVETAFAVIGREIEWTGEGMAEVGRDQHSGEVLCQIGSDHFRPAEVHSLVGNAAKAKNTLDWSPKVSFDQLVDMMVVAQLA